LSLKKSAFRMPHFIIDIDQAAYSKVDSSELMNSVHEVAVESKLFDTANIKVRIKPYQDSLVAGKSGHFIHVFSNIMGGRTNEQRASLSNALVSRLNEDYPWIAVISVNVQEFEKSTYCNLNML
jgi:5-carboxymethyl-2-hydroxymuconate isomerase